MTPLATLSWTSPASTPVSETLTLYDDGTAWLVVLSPRALTGPVGTFVTTPSAEDLAALTAGGPDEVVFDRAEAAGSSVRDAAERVAQAARAQPRATATFHAGPVNPIAGGVLPMSIFVIAGGTVPVELLLKTLDCTVHFGDGTQELDWVEMPRPAVDFVTPKAIGLGGIRYRGAIEPEDCGASAFDVRAPGGATTVAIDVHGWLYGTSPVDDEARSFQVRTTDAPIPG